MAVLLGRQVCAARWRCWSSDGVSRTPRRPAQQPQKDHPSPIPEQTPAQAILGRTNDSCRHVVAQARGAGTTQRVLFQVLSQARQAADLIAPEPAAPDPDAPLAPAVSGVHLSAPESDLLLPA